MSARKAAASATRPTIERLCALNLAIRQKVCPSAYQMAQRLEVSVRTIKRDLDFLRDRLQFDFEFDRRHGYVYRGDPPPLRFL